MHFSQVRSSDLLLVDHDGTVVEGKRPVNRAAFAIHSAIHNARPDAIAAAHAHSPYGKTWSTFGRLLDPITQESCAFYNDHVVFDESSGVVLETSEGEKIAQRLGPRKAAILQNHGLLTVGTSVESALFWFIALEDACRTQLLAESAGKPKLISHEVAAQTVDQIDRLDGGKYGFEPFWDFISASQPDLLD
jgi:ribulose-5-phosphate 4-epimerase/fuculose-1-phosphate aldolase